MQVCFKTQKYDFFLKVVQKNVLRPVRLGGVLPGIGWQMRIGRPVDAGVHGVQIRIYRRADAYLQTCISAFAGVLVPGCGLCIAAGAGMRMRGYGSVGFEPVGSGIALCDKGNFESRDVLHLLLQQLCDEFLFIVDDIKHKFVMYLQHHPALQTICL